MFNTLGQERVPLEYVKLKKKALILKKKKKNVWQDRKETAGDIAMKFPHQTAGSSSIT